jgi:2-dehydro-3-deoxyphosphogalactonate aldolase
MDENRLASLDRWPLVAILRGVRPEESVAIAQAVHTAGIRVIEVPLNSPSPLDSIARMAASLPSDCLVGAGTVLDARSVEAVVDAGGQLIVSPNGDPSVIRRTLELGALSMPGVGTASEMFAAYGCGARHLKLFPASSYGASHLSAIMATLPDDCQVFPVGGVEADDLESWLIAGAAGFGFGSNVYRAGDSEQQVSENAARIVAAYGRAKRKLEGTST